MANEIKFIAELCQNHNGSRDLMFEMLDSAVSGGATHVKLQHIYVKNLTYRPEFEEGGTNPVNGQTFIKRPYQPEYDRLSGLELPEQVCYEFIKRCEELGVVPLTTCFCTEHAQKLADIGFKEIKVASYDCASPYLLEALKGKFAHIYVSTGATFDSEIINATNILQNDYTLLHCVTRYPTPIQHLNLQRLDWLQNHTEQVGYSDHSKTEEVGIFPACAAIYAGASVLERHFSILDVSETRDGPVSISAKHIEDIMSFAKLSRDAQKEWLDNSGHDLAQAMGTGLFTMSNEEYANRLYYRGRFASVAKENGIERHVYNWEML